MKLDMIIYHFVQELKRRRVFREIVVCGASTLIILEAGINISNAVGLDSPPNWFFILLVVGFIIAVWISWIYDITPEGIKKTESKSDQKVPIPKKKVRIYQATTLVSVLLIIGLLIYFFIDRENKKKYGSIDRSIAVLPLYDVDLSRSKIREFCFIGDRITTSLSKIKDYHVVPWPDCRNYKRSGKDWSTMGDELSAAVLVDWRPHESEDTRSLTVDLIYADNGEVLWSDNYQIEGSWADEISKYSKNISRGISRKLRVYPTLAEKAMVRQEPRSPRATMYASLGSAMTMDSWEREITEDRSSDSVESEYIDSVSFDRAVQYFTDAIQLDSLLAEAYANRAKARLWGIRAGFYERTMLDTCRKDIEQAFKLDADLPEAHVAMGFYYYYGMRGELKFALTSFEKALELSPGNVEYLFYLSRVHSALGNWEEVKPLVDFVHESNPRNVLFLTNLGISYLFLHEFEKSIECQDRAIEIKPEWYAPYINKIGTLLSMGNVTESRKVLKDAEEHSGMKYYRMLAELELLDGNYSGAAYNIERATKTEYTRFYESEGDISLFQAYIYALADDTNKSISEYRNAIEYFNNQLMFDPDDYMSLSRLGLAFAGIDEYQKAIEFGRSSIDLINKTEDEIRYPNILMNMAQIYAMSEDYESAQNIINELLDLPSPYTLEYLRLNPYLKPLLY